MLKLGVLGTLVCLTLINYVIDIQNMQEHNNNKELGILSLKVTYLSIIGEYPNLMHRSPLIIYSNI